MTFLVSSTDAIYGIPCQCAEFVQDFLNLSKEIFSTESEKLQWTVFEKFLNQQHQLWNKSNFRESKTLTTTPFNVEQCITSKLYSRMKELKNSGMTPSILIFDIMSNIYLKNTERNTSQYRNCLQWSLGIRTSFPNNYENLWTFVAFHGHTEFMKLLVNYGYLSSLPTDSPHLRIETRYLMFNFILSVSSTRNIRSVLKRIMDLLKSFVRGNEDGEFYRRMFFIGVALNAVRHNLKKEYNEAEKLINCLRMYFSATSELYLTIYEVRSVLYGTLVLLNQPDLFDIYFQEFDNLMPECPATLQPRKATHIARCQIRQNLKASNIPLPAAVEKLQLPKIVKHFVVCDVFDFASKNGNTSAKNVVTKSELESLLFGRPSS